MPKRKASATSDGDVESTASPLTAKKKKAADPVALFWVPTVGYAHYTSKKLFPFTGVVPPEAKACMSFVFGYNLTANQCVLNPMVLTMLRGQRRIFSLTKMELTKILQCLGQEHPEKLAVSLIRSAQAYTLDPFQCAAKCHVDNVCSHKYQPDELMVNPDTGTCSACAKMVAKGGFPLQTWVNGCACRWQGHYVNVHFTVPNEDLQIANNVCQTCQSSAVLADEVPLNKFMLYLKQDNISALLNIVAQLVTVCMPGSLAALAFAPQHVVRAGRLTGFGLFGNMLALRGLRSDVQDEPVLEALRTLTGLSYEQLCQLHRRGYLPPSAIEGGLLSEALVGDQAFGYARSYLVNQLFARCLFALGRLRNPIGQDPSDDSIGHGLATIDVTANIAFDFVLQDLKEHLSQHPVRLVLHAGHTLKLKQLYNLALLLDPDTETGKGSVLNSAGTMPPGELNPFDMMCSIDPEDAAVIEDITIIP